MDTSLVPLIVRIRDVEEPMFWWPDADGLRLQAVADVPLLEREPNSGGVTLPRMAAPIEFHTPDELRDLMATVIAGAAGGTKAKWSCAIGAVEQLPTWRNVRSNWRVQPTGSAADRRTIEQAAAVVRGEHPYVESEGERVRRRAT